jgi:hypothetical protein
MTTAPLTTPKILTVKSPDQLVRESRLTDALLAVDREFRLLGTLHALITSQSVSKVVMGHALKELEHGLRLVGELCTQVNESK